MTMTIAANPYCPYCGLIHSGTCPHVEEIEYHENGRVKRVKLRDPAALRPAITIMDTLSFDMASTPDPNTWYRASGWNFAHRVVASGDWTLCRRRVSITFQDHPPVADERDERCPTCSSILSESAL